MADLDPAHVEAVARAMVEVAYHDIAVEFSLTFLPTGDNRASVPPHWEGDAMVKAEHYAKALMESTDPAVHAALLAALVRAGVLEEEHRDCCSTCGATYGLCANIDEACTDAAWIEQRRYLSKWEETCD